MSDAHESIEIERKYEVDADAVLPTDYTQVELYAGDPERMDLRATYFDTSDGHLARRLVAVRRREGGSDAGWHLKAKNEVGARELHWPPAPEMPVGLKEEIDRITDSPVTPLAELVTERRVITLHDGRGSSVIEVADDRVDALHHSTGVRRAWREWEAELLPGADPAMLDAIEPMLLGAGASLSASPAKIVRAAGLLPEFDARDRDAARRLDA